MANNNDNETKLISVRVNIKDWQELDNNINTSKSQFIRDAIKRQNEKDTDLKELHKKLKRLENEKQLIECEIKETKKEIHKLNQIQTENENNTILIMDKMETINNIINNNGGITEKQINTIANNEIKPEILIKECRTQGLKIIKENQINKDKQGNIINVKTRPKETRNKNHDIKTWQRAIKEFNNNWQSNQHKYKDKEAYLLANETEYKNICNDPHIYKNFKDHVLRDAE